MTETDSKMHALLVERMPPIDFSWSIEKRDTFDQFFAMLGSNVTDDVLTLSTRQREDLSFVSKGTAILMMKDVFEKGMITRYINEAIRTEYEVIPLTFQLIIRLSGGVMENGTKRNHLK